MRVLTTPIRIASVAVMAALVLVQPASQADGDHSRAQLVASAQASPGIPSASESLTAWDKVGRAGRVTTTATSSASCDGCDANASAVHVVRTIGGGGTSADNVAVAWANSCTGCRASAVSVQVVLVVGSQPIVANNRSLAVNAACVGCTSDATAVQFILVGGKRSDLSEAAQSLLRQLVRDLRGEAGTRDAAPRSGSTDARHRSAAPQRGLSTVSGSGSDLLDNAGRALQRDLGATGLTVNVDRHTGS
ncbi:hypothetical protein GCM10027053_53380 [Intrasporangium mesophilum]